jgi:hypothetical protein
MRFFSILVIRLRVCGVVRKSRCRSSMKIRKMRPETSLVGRARGRMMPSGTGGGGGLIMLYWRPPWITTIDAMSCLTPSS